MANPPRGRPRLSGSVRQIRLRTSVFELWNQRKRTLGFCNSTNSEFAEFLLHLPTEWTRSNTLEMSDNAPMLCSTPLPKKSERPAPVRLIAPKRQRIEFGCMNDSSKSLDVDVTGTSSRNNSNVNDQKTSINSVVGNPFSFYDDQPASSSESESDDDDDDDYERISRNGDFQFGDRLDSVIEEMCQTDSEDSDGEMNSLSEDGTSDMNISLRDDEATLTMIEDAFPEDEPEDLAFHSLSTSTCHTELFSKTDTTFHSPSDDSNMYHAATTPLSPKPSSSACDVQTTEEPKDLTMAGNVQEVLASLEASFSNVTSVSGLQDPIELYSRCRVVVSVEKLIELNGRHCKAISDGCVCGKELQYGVKRVATRVDLDWKCASGHCGKWESSEVLAVNRYSKVYANDSLLSIALILSGNNYAKFELFCKALNLCSMSKSNFCHFQAKCALPVVKNVWSSMRCSVLDILKNYKEICLSGDGRNDSPGHSARYCVYSLMEHCTKVIVDLEVIDKRETGGNSTIMEKEGLRRLLEKLMNEITVSELCTDASSSVIKLVRDMKAKFPLLAELFHSLDIWHKAKKLTKALHKAAKVKGCAELKVWVDPIVNHFWYCSQVCEGNADELKSTWQGVLHHVCGEHTWAESACNHGPEAEEDKSKPPLSKSSKAMAALRKIVLDVKWLKTLHFYVRFRHTGELENFNSMMTKYAPKRIAFEYPYFIMRILLAAIDHNFHLFRKPKQTAAGKLVGHRKYSKRTQRYHAEFVKEEKTYRYFPYMAAKMLENRSSFLGSFSSRADVNEFDPKQIAPTLAMKAPPPTAELMKAPSRFKLKHNNTNCSE